ncbi:MAG: fimbrial protein [Deltaproteobacteria bacterium]|nr:fimbrial protein [Deltaproteobacteria bacterium]
MIKINLLPVRAARKKETVRQMLSIAGLSLILLFIVLGGVYWNASSRLTSIEADISRNDDELRRLKKKVGELSRLKEQKKIVMEKLKVVKQLETRRTGPVRFFQSVSEAIPKKVWVEKLKETTNGVTLSGYAATEELVADFMRGLERFPEVGKVELDIVKKGRKRGNVELFSFTIRLVKSEQKKI